MLLQLNANKDNHRKILADSIKRSEISVLCSGWLKHAGLKHLLPAIDLALKNGSQITIYSNKKHTDSEAIESIKSRESILHIVVDDSDKYLHSKIYYFESAGEYKAIIGSANITNGGLISNEELSVNLSGTIGDSQNNQIKKYLARLKTVGHPN